MNSRYSQITIIATLWTVVMVCTSCSRSDYSRFLCHKQDYYARLAAECDSLLPRGPAATSAEARGFARETNSLPPTIKDLSPTQIRIKGDAVMLTVGSYFIVWRQSDQDKEVWILVADHEGHRREVYSRRKPAALRARVTTE